MWAKKKMFPGYNGKTYVMNKGKTGKSLHETCINLQVYALHGKTK